MTDSTTPAFSYAQAIAWTFAVTAVLLFGVIAVSAVYPPLAKSLVAVGLWEVVVYLGASRLFSRSVLGSQKMADVFALRRTTPSLVAAALVLGVVLHVPANSLAELVERIYPTPPEMLEERLARLTPSSTLHGAVIFAIVVLLVPLVEELFFRGALLSALLRSGRLFGACAVSALCFVAAHADPHLWIPLLIVAAALTHLRWTSGSLWPGVALHASFNGLTLLAVFSGMAPETPTPNMSLKVVISGWVLAGASWWVSHRLAQRARLTAPGGGPS